MILRSKAVEAARWEGCQVTVHRHLDDTISIGFGPHEIGRFAPDGQTLKTENENSERES
ncbi:MAG: hypothetical protein KF855_08155 [Acidobacteria bacterium]|nr:hypothetical protein [Acidobacteriota bacterium]